MVYIFIPNEKIRKAEIEAKSKGFVIREPGMDKDVKRYRKEKEEKANREVRKSVVQTLMDFDIPDK